MSGTPFKVVTHAAAGVSAAQPIRATRAPDDGDAYPPAWLPPKQRRALKAGARPSSLFGR